MDHIFSAALSFALREEGFDLISSGEAVIGFFVIILSNSFFELSAIKRFTILSSSEW
jgi:hypothetical protein